MLWVIESVLPYSLYIFMAILSSVYFYLVFSFLNEGLRENGK